jgi:hypothetical protein
MNTTGTVIEHENGSVTWITPGLTGLPERTFFPAPSSHGSEARGGRGGSPVTELARACFSPASDAGEEPTVRMEVE